MKRDMDLIRQILIAIENAPNHTVRTENLEFSGFTPEEIGYNTALLIEAGYVQGNTSRAIGERNPSSMVGKLNWSGHEFLDATRNDTVWNKTKERAAVVGGNITMGTFTEIASAVAKSMMGLA